jgi:hypothetical protein
MGISGLAGKDVWSDHLHGRCLDANNRLADGDSQFKTALKQCKDAEFWVLVHRWKCIFVRTLPDHKTAVAEVEFSDGAAQQHRTLVPNKPCNLEPLAAPLELDITFTITLPMKKFNFISTR